MQGEAAAIRGEAEAEWRSAATVVEVVRGAWFCSNADCELHVRAGDAGVFGAGEWAVRGDGVVTSRRLAGGRMLCDLCAKEMSNA